MGEWEIGPLVPLNYLPNYNHVSNRRIEEEEDIFPEKRADLQ